MRKFVFVGFFFMIFGCQKEKISYYLSNSVNPKIDSLGLNWTHFVLDNPFSVFIDIAFVNAKEGYVLTNGNTENVVLRSIDSGKNWNSYITKVPFIKNGFSQSYNNFAVTSGGKIVIVRFNSVSTFDYNFLQNNFGNFGIKNDVYFINDSLGYVTSNSGLLKTVNGGTTWKQINLSLTNRNIEFSDNSEGIIFLNDSVGCFALNNRIMFSMGNDSTWTSTEISGCGRIYALSRPSKNVIYFTAQKGVFRSVDSGKNFEKITPFHFYDSYSDIEFIDDFHGFITNKNFILETTDSGKNWKRVLKLGQENIHIIELDFINESSGWACTDQGTILRFQK